MQTSLTRARHRPNQTRGTTARGLWLRNVAASPPTMSTADVVQSRLPLVEVDASAAREHVARMPTVYRVQKRFIDLLLTIAMGVVALVILPFVAFAIKLDSPGPVFYSQHRLGLTGQVFRIYKFRSMAVNAETNGAVWAREGDPRVTRVGKYLRKSRLDELPQLWNVFRGHMTLVGPRPERPEFAIDLENSYPGFSLRLLVKPGLTGWAQVKHRYTNSIADTITKLEYDLYYIKHAGTMLDLRILVRTVGVVFGLKGL